MSAWDVVALVASALAWSALGAWLKYRLMWRPLIESLRAHLEAEKRKGKA